MIAEGVAESFQLQAMLSPGLGSPLYGTLLELALADLQQGGIVAEIVDGWTGHATADVLPLRMLGAVHRLVLQGKAPELARCYPSTGGTPQWPQTWDAFLAVLRTHRDIVRQRLTEQLQTNEVSRSAALLGGFLRIAAETGLPLRLYEIGSSAGLNLAWDRYRYESETGSWGDPVSALVLRPIWHGTPRDLGTPVNVDGRFGCDINPIDVCKADDVRMLESFIWPDQLERLAQLRAAIAEARKSPPQLTRQTASAFLRDKLAEPSAGVAAVVFHSVMWWYLPEAERDAVTSVIEQRGARATPAAPFAYLQLEPRHRDQADLALRLWPGGEEVILAQSHPHGREVWWR